MHLFDLKNQLKFNVSGQMSVRTSVSGRDITFSATHSNRTVKLWTDYEMLEQQFKQHSRIELDPSTWIEYDLSILNKTVVILHVIFLQYFYLNIFVGLERGT